MSKILLAAAILLGICMPVACGNPNAPCVNTLQALNITDHTAELWGYLDEDAEGTWIFHVWRADEGPDRAASYANPHPITGPNSFSCVVDRLEPETTYEFKAGATVDNVIGWGNPVEFTTLAEVVSPVVTTGDATDVTSESATLHGELVSLGQASELYTSFELGTTSGAYSLYFTAAGVFQSPGAFSVDATGLTPETTYYYRAGAASTSVVTVYGEEKSFKTGKGAELTILSHQADTDHATFYKVTGQAQNTGTKLLEQAQIEVVFEDGVGTGYYAYAYTENLGLGETWTWEASCPEGVDFSTIVSNEVSLSYIYPAT